ncbi:ABC transporter G family member 21-like [Penaeus monodon]|uniref:ABC transporter G family member 21-like n=1 Tax=Penaeus monodon TaxID=6687 RepID=UPI0018A756AD|nr:ABC transporter G family member 21-like [Penaeus monodon]XP_037798404.1 ABC transporter G family member 21-like [Penaeus monodon]XP_037798405.1 ABC transporter G family member 21-like [Penaeus monodon]
MDSIWSTRRYVPVTVDIDLLAVKGKKILKSVKTKRGRPQQNPSLQQCLQKHPQLHVQVDSMEGQPLKHNCIDQNPVVMPISAGMPRRRPLQVEFNDVSLTIGETPILSRLTGSCRPGEVLAIMGPSGSGKTSLLNTISGRLRPTSGTISIGGEALSKRHKRHICYVLQQDVFFTDLTLRQTLMYTALLRLPDSMPYQEKMNHVNNILDILDLKRCQNTIIGNMLKRGLSGGEKKRANIACELLTNPSIMLLDEPTSGLDSSTAYSLITTLKQFAEKENRTIILTLHQPSSQIFYMLDSLLLLCNGQNAYFGDTRKVVEHFSRIGLPISPHYNPADFILELVKGSPEVQERVIQGANCPERRTTFNLSQNITIQTSPSIHSLYSKYLSLQDGHTTTGIEGEECPWDEDCNCQDQGYHAKCPPEVSVTITGNKKETSVFTKMGEEEDSGRSSWSEETESEASAPSSLSEEYVDRQWPTSFLTQFKILTQRNFCVARPFILSRLHWIQTLVLALIAGLLWFQIPRTEETMHGIQGWMFFSTTYWMLFMLFNALQSFPSEREVIMKERSSGSYRVSAYYLAKMVGELPLTLTLPMFYMLISYPMMRGIHVLTFTKQLFVLLLNTLVAQSMGLLIGAICMDLQVAITVSALFTLFSQLFAGYLSKIPPWLKWAEYLSMVHYAFQNMSIIEFTDGTPVRCSKENSRFESCKGDNITYISVSDIQKETGGSLWLNTSILILFMLLARLLTYLMLRFLHRPK